MQNAQSQICATSSSLHVLNNKNIGFTNSYEADYIFKKKRVLLIQWNTELETHDYFQKYSSLSNKSAGGGRLAASNEQTNIRANNKICFEVN